MNMINQRVFRFSGCALAVLAALPIAPAVAVPQSFSPSKSASSPQKSEIPSDLTIEEQVDLVRKRLLAGRPYKSDFSGASEVVSLEVLPSTLSSSATPPDWWSEKQSYDLARLYALALGYYPIFDVVPPETWDKKVLASQNLPAPSHGSNDSTSETGTRKPLAASRLGVERAKRQTRFDVDLYNFQHMPVKRRGIGLGFIAITSKECSTETYLRSLVSLSPIEKPQSFNSAVGSGFEGLDNDSTSIPLNRIVVDKTGGTSLNLNFLVGGAGGGNFDPPAKPLKEILLESVVDAAELTSCLATDNQKCIDYYRSLPRILPTKLNKKQKKKVGSC